MGESVEKLIVNADTGEVISTIGTDDRIKIYRKEQQEYYNKHKELIESKRLHDFGQGKEFVKLNLNAIERLLTLNFSQSDTKILFYMIKHLHYKSGLVAYGNNKPINLTNIKNDLEISQSTLDRSIKRLYDEQIIAIVLVKGNKQFYLNPFILVKGYYINETLYAMFKNTVWNMRK